MKFDTGLITINVGVYFLLLEVYVSWSLKLQEINRLMLKTKIFMMGFRHVSKVIKSDLYFYNLKSKKLSLAFLDTKYSITRNSFTVSKRGETKSIILNATVSDFSANTWILICNNSVRPLIFGILFFHHGWDLYKRIITRHYDRVEWKYQ